MSRDEAYHLSLTPEYLPDRQAPETLTGEVAFASAGAERVVCRVEIRAVWEDGGEVTVAEPDPSSLPGLTADEIKELARKFAAQFRDDRVQGRTDPDAADYTLTPAGEAGFSDLGLDLSAARAKRRRFACACLDWSERRPHLAGALGAALLRAALARKWLTQDLDSRALHLTDHGRREMQRRLGGAALW